MLELLQEIIKDRITPNQLLLLFAIDESISFPQINPHLEIKGLKREGYIIMNEDLETGCELSDDGKMLKIKYNNYFIKGKKKTNSILMGKDYNKKVEEWRELWPAKKLPSGKPARTNVRTLTNNFKWFFENYDYTWDEIFKATNRYIDQYEVTDYLYMKTSQYFIAKSDSSRVKLSELADCCDMLKEGLDEDITHFKEKIV